MKFEIITAEKDTSVRITTEVLLDAFKLASQTSRTVFDQSGNPVFVIEIGKDKCLSDNGMVLSAQSMLYTVKASSRKALKHSLGLIKKYADQIEEQVEREYDDLEELANQIEEI